MCHVGQPRTVLLCALNELRITKTRIVSILLTRQYMSRADGYVFLVILISSLLDAAFSREFNVR